MKKIAWVKHYTSFHTLYRINTRHGYLLCLPPKSSSMGSFIDVSGLDDGQPQACNPSVEAGESASLQLPRTPALHVQVDPDNSRFAVSFE